MQPDQSHTNHLAAYFSGVNPETFDREEEPTADSDGQVISGTILKNPNDNTSLVPVRVRIAHGVSAETASTMLRKIADLIDDNPSFTSDRAGAAIRRLPDGTYAKKQLTIESMLAAAEQLPKEDRNRLLRIVDQIRIQIDDPKRDKDNGPDEHGLYY